MLISASSSSFKSSRHLLIAVVVYIYVIHGHALRRSSERLALHKAVQHRSQPLHSLTYVQANLIKVEDQSNPIASERLITSALSELIISIQPWG